MLYFNTTQKNQTTKLEERIADTQYNYNEDNCGFVSK